MPIEKIEPVVSEEIKELLEESGVEGEVIAIDLQNSIVEVVTEEEILDGEKISDS